MFGVVNKAVFYIVHLSKKYSPKWTVPSELEFFILVTLTFILTFAAFLSVLSGLLDLENRLS